MFIVGVSIPFAVANRQKKGASEKSIWIHALKRSFILLLLGWALYCVGPGRIVFRLQDVLAQLSVTYLVAFLIRNKSLFPVSVYHTHTVAGRFSLSIFSSRRFNHPWVAFQNLGAWVNNKIEGVDKASIWASLNAFPTIAHTVWGVLCGKLLMSSMTNNQKIWSMIIAGLSGLLIGYSLDFLNITPIIKKIATSSFVFVGGGWAILALCFCYWLIDVKRIFIKGSKMFLIVGMNCIFIYLLFEVGGAELLTKIFTPFTKGLFSWGGEVTILLMTILAVWVSLWYICYLLYKNKIFIKI